VLAEILFNNGGILILVNALQPVNAATSIRVVVLGIVILDNFEQFKNALEPILKREELGSKVIFVKFVQPENAELPILVVALGIVIFVNLVLLKNALATMLVIVEARIIFWLLVAGNSVFEYPVKVPSVIFVKFVQPENAELLMLATELGIVILVKRVLF
jgi:hypothetical protein